MSDTARVVLDVSAGEGAVAFLRDAGSEVGRVDRERRWAALADSPAYRAWAAFNGYGDEVLAGLRCSLPARDSVPSEEGLLGPVRAVLAAFTDSWRQLERLSARLGQVRTLPVAEAAMRALTVLPYGTFLQSTIFVLLVGDRQAVATDRAEVLIDLLAVPSVPAARLLLDVLAHELHHNGLDWCRQRDGAAQQVLARRGSAAAAVTALHTLLSEGAANAFFTPSSDGWVQEALPGLVDIYGVEETAEYVRRLGVDRARLPDLLKELDSSLSVLASGGDDPDAQAYVRGIARLRPGMSRPVAHLLGEAMVNAIRRHAGDGAVVDGIRDLRGFVPAYQAAASTEGLPTLRRETVEALDAMWSG